MKHHRLLLPINVALAVAVVGVLLGCGGDPVDPPKGSLEAKMKGSWEADPIPAAEGEVGIRHVTRTISISFWNGGKGLNGMSTMADYYLKPVAKETAPTEPKQTSTDMGEFTYDGLIATSDVPREDGSVWELRLDANDQNTLYVTWTQKDGTKQLDGVKFHKK
jgi:hypothetical protein